VSASSSSVRDRPPPRVALDALERFCRDALSAAGADEPTVDAATRAMMHGSRMGIDSHGVQLLNHYVTVLMGGRVNPKPKIRFTAALGGVATLDADHGHGALAAYSAMEHAVFVAKSSGICAVAIRNSSHFGPAGAFALAAAEAGCIGIVTCNSDSFVRLHDGAAPFHGTNPIACAVPVGDDPPWLFDMATSAIPYNRVKLNPSLGITLPEDAASDAGGLDTQDPDEVRMLAPLGAAFAYKGAGLAGIAEILSAVLTGMTLSFEAAPMAGPDFSTPRQLGAFVLAIDPGAFIDRQDFDDRMKHYLASLRTSAARPGSTVLAPGDREWAEAERRRANGVPLDPATVEAFKARAGRFGLALPFDAERGA
jgi:LDH2 family malate/lactate/ureidoglycolate dehydrogenase